MKHHFALPVVFAALVGSFSQYSNARQNDHIEHFDALVEKIMMFEVSPESVFRNGDTLHFQMNGEGGSAQVSSSCQTSEASIDYVDLDSRGRNYIGGDGSSYAPPYSLGKGAIEKLNKNSSYKKLCNDVPKPKLKVLYEDSGKSYSIDIGSVKSMGNKKSLWMIYDYPFVDFDVPYNAPYSQKREHIVVDCDSAQAHLLAGYDVNFDGTVTDGKAGEAARRIGNYSLTGSPDDRSIWSGVCVLPLSDLKQFPDYSPRVNPPIPLSAPSIEEQPLQAIRKLSIPPAQKNLSYLGAFGVQSEHGKEGVVEADHYLESSGEGYLKVLTLTKNSKKSAYSFLGLFDLSSKLVVENDGENNISTSQVSYLEFSGDWVNLSVGSKVSYSIKETRYNSAIGQVGSSDELQVYNCSVEEETPAPIAFSSLTSKRLVCSLEGDEYNRVNTYYFLSDYGYFFHGSTLLNGLVSSRTRIRELN